MKEHDEKLRCLIGCLAAATVAGGALWCVQLFTPGRELAFAGLAVTAAGAVLLLILWKRLRFLDAERRRREAEQQDWGQELLSRTAEESARCQKEMAEFRSSLAHGLRMPLSIIRGYAEMLADGMVTDEALQKEYLQKMIQRSQYMAEVLNRQFSQEDTVVQGKLQLSRIDLLEFVEHTAADMQAAAAEKCISLQVVSKERELLVEVDTYLLSQALFNLVENTLKYMGRPGTCTMLVLRRENEAVLKIQDDGMGMPREETARIFELHYQGSNSKNGQGRGLYLVKKIVEAHGGTISATSAVGQGMSMTITLPIRNENS